MRRWRQALGAVGRTPAAKPRRRGFFIPYDIMDEVPERPEPYPAFEALFEAARPTFEAVLDVIDGNAESLAAIGATEDESPPPHPRWEQDWFVRLDAAAAYALVRARSPQRIVEIGSGFPTSFMVRAAIDGNLPIEYTSIDPEPPMDLRDMGITTIEAPVQQAGFAPYRGLADGDILFVETSHVAMQGTDVDFVVNRILPCLPPGVLVHLNGITLPDPYPPEWSEDGFNEQAVVAALLAGGGFRVVFASRWVATRMAERLARSPVSKLPLVDGAIESSLWIEKVSPPLAYL
jgi:hypothetical protein